MRLSLRIKLLCCLPLLLLVGCSSLSDLKSDISDRIFGREPVNPPAELTTIKAKFDAKIVWSAQAGATDRYDFTPALDAGFVYAANAKGEIVKLDAANGRQVWRVNAGETISGGVGTGGGLVMVGTNRGDVLAYDINGKLVWKTRASSEVLSAPRYFDGYVIVRSGNSHIAGFDAADGSRKWVYERTSPTLSLRSSAGLIVDGGAVYAGFAGGKMVSIRADNGKLLWEASVAQPKGVTEIERISDITSLPVVDGPVVYAVAYQGRVAAVDRRSGKVLWNRDISSYSGLSVENGKVYIAHALGSVYALNDANSKTFWRQPALLNRRLTAPLPLGDVVAIGDLEGYIHFLDRDDGSIVGRIKLSSNPVMALIGGDSKAPVIAETRGGEIYAISLNESKIAPSQSKSSDSKPAPAPEQPADEAAPQTRSILFRDNPVLPGVDSGSESGPGIRLPNSPEPQ
jgi:outer membrane protein assembly factor BamB